jgi:hypothetical protein
MIFGIHAVLFGFACFVAGFGSLAAPNQSEIDASRRGYEIERDKSWLHGFKFAIDRAASARNRSLSLAAVTLARAAGCAQVHLCRCSISRSGSADRLSLWSVRVMMAITPN